MEQDNGEAAPEIRTRDRKVSELLELKNLIDDIYGEGVFYRVVEQELFDLFQKELAENVKYASNKRINELEKE